MEIYEVLISKKAKNDLRKVPHFIAFKLMAWIGGIKEHGLSEIKKRPGFHDEPLKGNRLGQRSVRLNKSYRAIYEINQSGVIQFIEVIEVNKHEY